MNEKRETIAIILLCMVICISLGFYLCSWTGNAAGHDHASDARDVLESMEFTLDEFGIVHGLQGGQLIGILDDLRAANEYIDKLEYERERSIVISGRTNAGLAEIAELLAEGGGDFEAVINRQHRINGLFRNIWEDNRQLRETLGVSD